MRQEKIMELAKELRKELFLQQAEISVDTKNKSKTQQDYLEDCVINYERLHFLEMVDNIDALIGGMETSKEEKLQAFREVAEEQFDGDAKKLSLSLGRELMDKMLSSLMNLI